MERVNQALRVEQNASMTYPLCFREDCDMKLA